MDEILTTARDLELEINEDGIEELIMGHEDELTIEELQEILNEEHQETQRNVSPSEQEKDEIGPMRTSAIKDLLKKKIGSRVGRNQTTVMRICDRWMQDVTTDLCGRSHRPQCTTSREDRQIVRMAVTDRSVTSLTIAQHIESVTHHSVSARTIRRRLQQSGLSARRQLLGLPLTQNHRRLRRQWCDERRNWGWQN
ncbi:transposable element Tcb1 transposase [Trichonephila clavipes]|nr:transposable element Tcb1 transposase [Trichonephila clavipes]